MAEMQMEKNGEMCLNVNVRRAIGGVNLSVKTHPSVEALFRSWGDGGVRQAHEYVRDGWLPLGADRLRIYNLAKPNGIQVGDDGENFCIDLPGHALITGHPATGHDNVLNLSFLRLAGISEGTGVSFSIKGVYTIEALKKIVDRIRFASRRMYNSYLKPAEFNLQVFTSVQEIPTAGTGLVREALGRVEN